MSDRSLLKKIQTQDYNHKTGNRTRLTTDNLENPMSDNLPDGVRQVDLDRANEDLRPDPDPCECYLEPGEPCPNAATRIMEEPWTPARFKTLCCDSCAEDKLSLGYHDRGIVR